MDLDWTGSGYKIFIGFGLDSDCKLFPKFRIRTGIGLSLQKIIAAFWLLKKLHFVNLLELIWTWTRHFCPSLQRHDSPTDSARELFRPSRDSANLLVKIGRKIFVLGLWFPVGVFTSGGVFSSFWPTSPDPGRQTNETIFWLKVFVETSLSSESLESFIDFLAYLDRNL